MIKIRPESDLPKTTAQTIRLPSTALFTVSSKDRFKDYLDRRSSVEENYKSPYNFLIYKNQSLFNGFFTRIGLTEVVFPWTIPNINTKTNAISYTVIGGLNPGTFLATLDNGFYRPSQIASSLQTAIIAELPSFTMSYGVINGIPCFSYGTGDVNIEISFNPLAYNSSQYPFSSNIKQLFDLLGFNNVNTELSVFGVGGSTFCSFIEYVDFICQDLTYNQALKDGTSQQISRDSISRVYIQSDGTPSFLSANDPDFCPAGCEPFIIYRQFTNPKQIQWSPSQPLGQVQIQVYDDQGELLTDYPISIGGNPAPFINTGTDFNLTFLVSEN